MRKDILNVDNMTFTDLDNIMKLSELIKRRRLTWDRKSLAGKTIAMIFSKSSTRTRVSFEVGIRELGGNALFLDQNDMQLGRGESIEDTAKVLSRYIHGVVIRTYRHADVVELAKFAKFPVINALTDEFHPCQILTDLFTMSEFSGKLDGVKVAFVGDCASNMANSMILAANLAGLDLRLTSPANYAPSKELMRTATNADRGTVKWTENIEEAVDGVDYIYTDVWVSMGMEEERQTRLTELQPYQVTNEIVKSAGDGVRIMHCLPAHRGEEIAADVIDSHKSIVFDQAENRLHVQKAIMTMLLDEDWKQILEEG